MMNRTFYDSIKLINLTSYYRKLPSYYTLQKVKSNLKKIKKKVVVVSSGTQLFDVMSIQ